MKRETFGVAGLLLRTSGRAPARLVATLLALWCADFGLGLALVGRASVDHAVATGVARLGADLLVVPRGETVPLQKGLVGGLPMAMSLDAVVVPRLETIDGVAVAAPQYFLTSSAASCCDSGSLLLIGFDPAHDLTITPWAAERAATVPRDPVWVGAQVHRGPNDILRLYDIGFRVAARLDATGIGYFDNAVFVPLDGVRRMEAQAAEGAAAPLTVAWGRPSAVLLRVAPGQRPADVAARIEAALPMVQVVTPAEAIHDQRARMQGLLAAAPWLAALLAALAAAVGVAAQILYWSQRRSALGLLIAMGARRRVLIVAYAVEALVVGGVAALLGVGGSLVALRLFAPWARVVLGLPMLPSAVPVTTAGFVLAVAVPIAVVVVAAVVVVGLRLRREPYALIRRER